MVDTRIETVTADSLISSDMATTQDFTVSGFGTATAWIVTVSHTGDGALIGVGFGTFDGVSVYTNAWAGAEAQDNDSVAIWVSDADAQFEAQALDHVNGGIVEVLEATAALITDGIRLTYTTKPTAALRVRVDLIQCENAYVDNLNSGVVGQATTAPGFQGNVLLQVNAGGLVSTAGYRPGIGMAVEDSGGTIRQCCLMLSSGGNNTGITGALPLLHLDSTRFLAFLTGASVKSSWTLSSFDATGFTWVDSEGANNIGFAYLLLEISDVDVWCGALATPTSTGSQSYTDPGFGAGVVFTVPSYADTLDSTLTTGANGTIGFGVWDGADQACMSCSVEDAANPTNTSSVVSTTQGLLAKADDGTTGYAGTISSAGSGFAVNFTTAPASARYFLALVLGASDQFEALDETVGVLEEALGHSFLATEETVGISEEVVYLLVDALPGEADVIGEGGFPSVVTGEGGSAGVADGES